jgi:uncharacterized OsmC-like protein
MDEARQWFAEFRDATEQNPARLGQFTEAYATYMAETNYSDTEFAELQLNVSAMSEGALLAYHFTRGAAAAKMGNVANANESISHIAAIEPPPGYSRWSEEKREIAQIQIKAFLAYSSGDKDAALELLAQAVEVESTVPAESGLPSPENPSPELYGDLLAEMDLHELAVEQFEATLKHYPNRSHSLLGLARSARAIDDADGSKRAYELLSENWKDADPGIDGLNEVLASAAGSQFSAVSREVIKNGIRNRQTRDPSSLITITIEIEAGDGFAYSSRKLGQEEHHAMLTDEPLSRGGMDSAASPLGLFVTGLGACLLNQFNRLSVTEDLDLRFSSSTVKATFSGEEGGDFKEFVQDVYAYGDATDAAIRDLTDRVDGFCRISTTLQKSTPMTTVLHVNGEEVSRRNFAP